jgi:hypothetical protein
LRMSIEITQALRLTVSQENQLDLLGMTGFCLLLKSKI